MAEHGIDNVEFREGSIYELGFPDASFDVCTLLSMMGTFEAFVGVSYIDAGHVTRDLGQANGDRA